MTSNEKKGEAIRLLRAMMAVEEQRRQLADVDIRLLEYYDDLCEHSGIELGDLNDHHNMWELLGALKVLRLFRLYDIDVPRVRMCIKLREGEWHKRGDKWVHDRGGLLLPGSHGTTYYRWMPFQVFILAAMYGAKAWIDTEVPNGSRDMLPTERAGEGGTIEDYRRLCTDFTFYSPRKTDKTGLSAYNNFLFFMFEDFNSEIYCCANSSDQAKILYQRTQQLIAQMDPKRKRIRMTQTVTNWMSGQPRQAELRALSAGGRTKDGLCAQLCCADEYGSAGYVNGTKSDMGALVNVVLSSMGPRREPMMFTSTTAGNVQSGPFIDKLNGMKKLLEEEIAKGQAWERGEERHDPLHRLADAQDRWSCIMLQPDDYEIDEEYMLTSKVLRKKVNPALGVIVQHSFYDGEVAASRLDPLKRVETLTKLINVYQQQIVKDWVVTGDKVRRLQQPRRVTDCLYQDGWNTWVGLDFSSGEDLFAITYLSVNIAPGSPDFGQFFADCEAWIVQAELDRSANRKLYQKWIEQGWLNVCPGEVFNPELAINELMAKSESGVNLVMFGYDPAQSKQPINTIKAWLQSIGIDVDSIKSMVVPVSQNFMTFNGLIGEVEYMTLAEEPWLHFSESPLWPWEFGNAKIEESKDGLRKVLKSGVDNKVDNIHALIDALYCFDLSEGKINQ